MEQFELGMIVHTAFNDPKQLKKLEPKHQQAEELNLEELPAMLRIPKKKVAD